MIITTEHAGLHYSPNTPSGRLEMHLINQQRIERWREQVGRRERQGAADGSSRPSGWEVFCEIATAILWAGIIVAGIAIGWQIKAAAPEPETRTFERADGTSYTRTQSDWGTELQHARSGGQEEY